MADKTKVTMAVLIAVILVLASVITYSFVIKPRISGYVNLGYNDAIADIAQVAGQCRQIIPLQYVENGETKNVNIVAIECFPDRFPELFKENQSTSS